MPIPPPNSRFGPALALALLALALSNDAPAGAPAPDSTSAQSVRLLLVPAQEAKLSSPMAARIERINLQESERFHRGQALVVFDCEIQRAELHKAQAEVGAAEKTHASNVKLQTMHSISTLEVDLSAAQLDKARAEPPSPAPGWSNARFAPPSTDAS